MMNFKKKYTAPSANFDLLSTKDIMVLSTQVEENDDNLGMVVDWA